MKTFTRYVAFQVPGWVVAACIAAGLSYWQGISPWIAAALFLCWVAKDFCLYPFLRSSYEADVKTGAEQLVGTTVVARGPINPRGHVTVRGELWRAELVPGEAPLPEGEAAEVVSTRGFTLIVRRGSKPAPEDA